MTSIAAHSIAPRWHLAVAVLGLGAFGLSLAAGAWLFLVVLARPAESSPGWAVAANVGLFGLFATHHSVMARWRAKAWLRRHVPPDLERTLFVWVASLLFLAMCVAWRPMTGVAWELRGPARVCGYVAQVIGVLVTLHSAALLDLGDLAGIRQVRAAMQGDPNRRHAPTSGITRSGAFGWVRHPIYFGWLLMTLPCPDMTAGRLAFTVISVAYLAAAIPWEERALVAQHGDEYRRYAREARWRMVPGLY